MSRYNQYGQYYDPVGSQAHQPSGYTYQTPTSGNALPNASLPTSYTSNYQYGGQTYGSQQFGASTGQQSSNSASRAAAALSSLSNPRYNQTSSASRSNTSGQYENSSWYSVNSGSNTYNTAQSALPNRTQSNNSPIYAQSGSSFGRLSIPEQTQSSSNTYGASSSYQSTTPATGSSYQTSYTQQPSQPQRYNSPFQAVQAQQQQRGHTKQSSRTSDHQPSPQLEQAVHSARQQNASRQQSESVEPSPTTVDPSQVYDNRAELQRKAAIEAEKRRKHEAEQAAKRVEEDRLEAEQRKLEEEKAKAEAEKAEGEQAKKAAQKKAREEKKQSKSAATALTKMASGSARGASASPPPANEEEAEMRAMFKKMREFNSKNPAMLAKLWEEERKSHAQAQSPHATKASPATSSKAPAAGSAISHAATSAAGLKPFKRPTPAPTTAKASSSAIVEAAQMATPSVASPTQATTSLWPPHKKGTLAEATAKWLRSHRQNAASILTSQTVLNILDKNPSYVQLCESLEALGLKFERSALARELLRAVPDGLKAQGTAAAKSATPIGAPSGVAVQVNEASQGSPDTGKKKGRPKKDGSDSRPSSSAALVASGSWSTVNYEAPLSLSDAAREVNSMQQPSYHTYGATQSPYFAQPQSAVSNGSRAPSQSQPAEVKPEINPEEPPRPPADKEEAARKRTFGDLVDLTAEESDDEPPPKKIMSPVTVPSNGDRTQQGPPSFDVPAWQQQFKNYSYVPPGITHPHRPMSIPQAFNPNAPQPQSNGIPHAHPQQQQTPAPASQPAPPKSRGPSAEQQQQQRMRGKMLVEPIMRDRVARKSKYDTRTIARDVLLATGRHPDMRGLNHHLANMQKLLGQHGGEGGNGSDLSTVRWDLIDPEPEPETEKEEVKMDARASVGGEAVVESARKVPTVDYQIPANHEIRPPKKRGRPPRSSYVPAPEALTDDVGLGEARTSSAPRPASSTPRPATPSSDPALTTEMSASKAVGYASFQQIAADGTKKKGRPFGWRKNVHSREAQGLQPATLPSRVKGAPGRPPKEKVVEQEVQPNWPVYKCGWEGCKSELHNLETLKKHVIKVHGTREEGGDGQGEGGYVCGWRGCEAGEVAEFGKIEDWIGHVDKVHLSPLAWRLGDGPGVRDPTSLRHQPSSPPAYLSDRHGRSVTPIITPTPPESTHATAPTDAQEDTSTPPPAIKRLGRPPKNGISKSERDLMAPLRELEEHKKVVGPVMGRMGCVLVNDERRRGFLDDEDFEDEIEGEEDEYDDVDDT